MGFFSSLWDGIKSVAGKVYDVVRKPIDFIASAPKYIEKIPAFGKFISTAIKPVTDVAQTISGGLDTAKQIADVGKAIGLREGGIVPRMPMKKMYQA